MPPPDSPVQVRVAVPEDLDRVVATMTSAFLEDPVWGPAFPDQVARTEQAATFWRLFVASAQRYPWVLVTDRVEAAALWIPPGGEDLTAAESDGFEQFLLTIVDRPAANGILAVSEQFERHRPSEPHFYLSLLATHAEHRGAGLGMALLRENLARIDALGAPAYLESSNPVNDQRYRDVGFVDRDTFTIASGHVVTTMWRPAAAHGQRP
jgi:GNAT superfamily N-acetyltransferase